MNIHDIKISFDFDGVLSLSSEEAQLEATALLSLGYNVCILTTRYEEWGKEVYEVANKIGITEVNFTNYRWKYELIDSFNINFHVDDFDFEVNSINAKCKAKAILFDQNWRTNLIDEIIKKIQ